MKIQVVIYRSLLIYAGSFWVSCAGTRYQRPELSLPDNFRGQEMTGSWSAKDTGTADIAVHDFFEDQALLALIDSGLARNNDLLIAIRQIDAANEALKQARWANVPVTGLTAATASYTRSSDNSMNGQLVNQFLGKSVLEDYTSAVSLSWEADIWGKIRGQKEAALAAYLQTREAARAVQTSIVSGIAEGYFNLLMLDEQLEITNRTAALLDTTVEMTKAMHEIGDVPSLALQQQIANRQAVLASIPEIRQQIAAQENALSTLTGKIPGEIRRGRPVGGLHLRDIPVVGLPASLLNRRPDVRQHELALVQTLALTSSAKAAMYPSLNITAQGGLNAFRASDWFKIPGSLFGTALGSISQPVLQGRRLKTQYRQLKIQTEQAELSFKQSVLNAVEEVSTILMAAENLKKQQAEVQQQHDVLLEAVSSSGILYRNGMVNYLEVISAQNNLLNAQLRLAAIRRQQLSVNVQLYRAVGGGWQ